MLLKFVLLALICRMALANPFGTTQCVSVVGMLKCEGKPSVGTMVKLYDKDHFTFDDLMAQSKTNSSGHFRLNGTANEATKIDPKLNLYHVCNCNWPPPCKWKVTINIPKSYIGTGPSAKPFDVGVLNLEGQFSGQKLDCIH